VRTEGAENGSVALTASRVRAAFWTLLLVVAAARVIAVFTLNINWDEFALLERAVVTLRTGELVGGGRPGLATLILVPFAAACRNAVDTLVHARLLWTAIAVAGAVAFWFLLRGVLRPSPHRWAAAATGLGLWVLAPPFLHASTQVRTDQPAILFGLLGGLALLASQRRVGWGLGAGLLFGTGFLFSQKLLYVGGLAVAVTGGQMAIRGDRAPGRNALRAALAGAGFLAVVLAYRALMPQVEGTPALLPVSGGLSTFQHYREIIGWQQYRRMLPVLLPHGIAIAALVALSIDWVRHRGPHGAELATAWAVLLVGLAVMLFHAARFLYFYMVLGLFPATVGALVVASALYRLGTDRRRTVFLGALWLPLALIGATHAGALTVQTQQHQRASLEFVERSFSPEARGFEGRGAFACRPDPDPFPVRFYQRVRVEFGGEDRAERVAALLEEFRARPVEFMILPVRQGYPQELWEFWRTRYVPYHGAVHVPGRWIRGGPGWSGTFEVVAPGDYVWRTPPGATAPLEVVGTRVEPGTSIFLGHQGMVALRLPEGGEGMLVVALPQPPAPDTTGFYPGF
jgi:hypothetical protein